MDELGLSEQVFTPGAVRSRISHAKNALMTAQAFADSQTDYAGERIGRVFLLYERKLAAAGALDFDDLIVRPVRLLRSRPDFSRRSARGSGTCSSTSTRTPTRSRTRS